jgi:transposase
MDMSAGYAKSVAQEGHAPQAVICYDPFHVVQLATKALDKVRREVWNELRRVDEAAAKRFKGARWCLLKNPTDLSDDQAATLRKIRRRGGALWRAYSLKEALRAVQLVQHLEAAHQPPGHPTHRMGTPVPSSLVTTRPADGETPSRPISATLNRYA